MTIDLEKLARETASRTSLAHRGNEEWDRGVKAILAALKQARRDGELSMRERFVDELEGRADVAAEAGFFAARDIIESEVKHFRLNPIEPETEVQP